MAFLEHATELGGKKVVEYRPGIALAPEKSAYRLRVEHDSDETITDLLMALLEDPAADRLSALVIGSWSGNMLDQPPIEILEALVAAAGQLPSLTAIFLGDVIREECLDYWIEQTEVSPLWTAFPKLTEFKIRGTIDLSLGKLNLGYLKRLVVEGAGLPAKVLHELAASQLPALEHLELYLGSERYGWDGTVADVKRLLTGKLFPKLQYLGLRASEIADEVAVALARSPLLDRIKVLDLSLGTLSNRGAKALFKCPAVAELEFLDLHEHDISPAVVRKLQSLPIAVDVRPRDNAWEDDDRYETISE